MSALTDRLDEWAAMSEKATPGPWGIESADDEVAVFDEMTGCDFVFAPDPLSGSNRVGDAAFIAESRTATPALIEALRSVLELHKPVDIKVIEDSLCIAEECDHDGVCPETGTLTICAGCDDMCERADPYYSETNVRVVSWPCPTVDAIATALGVTP